MRYMAIDHGTRYIGIAISDPTGIVSRPLSTILHTSTNKDIQVITDITKSECVDKIILGLATDSRGSNAQATKRNRRFIAALKHSTKLPLLFWDESDSTLRAHQITKSSRSIESIHSIAAAVILQDYLDTHAQEQNST